MTADAWHLITLLVGAVVTVLSQRIGYMALVKKLESKADRSTVDDHGRRLNVLEDAHGGVLR